MRTRYSNKLFLLAINSAFSPTGITHLIKVQNKSSVQAALSPAHNRQQHSHIWQLQGHNVQTEATHIELYCHQLMHESMFLQVQHQ